MYLVVNLPIKDLDGVAAMSNHGNASLVTCTSSERVAHCMNGMSNFLDLIGVTSNETDRDGFLEQSCLLTFGLSTNRLLCHTNCRHVLLLLIGVIETIDNVKLKMVEVGGFLLLTVHVLYYFRRLI